MEDVNRIKLVLVEKKRTNKWLSDQMGVTPSTVSKWCTNSSQPDLPSLLKIADLLEVDMVVGKRYFEKAGRLRLGSESHRHAFDRPNEAIWQ